MTRLIAQQQQADGLSQRDVSLRSGESSSKPKRPPRRKTSHLKIVPETRTLRESLRQTCREKAAELDKSEPLNKRELESIARRMLEEMGHPEGYVGWTMVALVSAFWADQVAAVPPERRLFLLPHCLKHAEGCPADYDQFGLDCKRCGACSIADFRSEAEEMGYKVLVAEGSPIVLKIIVSGYVDAIVGVACLNVLERAIDKILLAGIPCLAVPLLSSDCRNTSVDEDWVHEMIHVRRVEPTVQSRTYLHLMRAAEKLCRPQELKRLVPRLRVGPSGEPIPPFSQSDTDPVAATESLALDFLGRGGKHSRPFITLAAYDAMTGAAGTGSDGETHLASLSTAIWRTALSIETFHKASLVHDDVEDDDDFRYGLPALHRAYGVPTAVNVGDYLIGLGYRLVACESASLGADVVADILDCLADAHIRLSEGQGAELMWRDARDKAIRPVDALKIYALKTAPAFEAALYAGLRLAGDATPYRDAIRQLARHLGVAFQVMNDLKDWQGDEDNKLTAGSDVLRRRPTVLWALAMESLTQEEQEQLLNLMENGRQEATMLRVRQIYQAAGVFEKAHRLVDKYQQRAEAVADETEPEDLRRFFYYLIDTVLHRPADDVPQIVTENIASGFPTPAP